MKNTDNQLYTSILVTESWAAKDSLSGPIPQKGQCGTNCQKVNAGYNRKARIPSAPQCAPYGAQQRSQGPRPAFKLLKSQSKPCGMHRRNKCNPQRLVPDTTGPPEAPIKYICSLISIKLSDRFSLQGLKITLHPWPNELA